MSGGVPLTGAFGFTIGPDSSPAIQQTLDNSKGVADMLVGTANTGLITQLAGTAAVADQLTLPVSQHIATALGNAAGTLGQMQSPIEQGIVTSLSSAAGNAVSLGANLPDGTNPTPQPTCVQIATEAQNGSLATAMQYVTNNVLPFDNPRTQQYYTNYNFVTGCLANFPQLLSQLQFAIQQAENAAHVAGSGFIGSGQPPGFSSPVSNPASATPTVSGGTLTPSPIFTTMPLTATNPLASQPAIPGSGQPPSTAIPSTPVVTPTSPVVGSGAPPVAQPLPATGSIPGSGAPPVAAVFPSMPAPGTVQTPNAGPNGETLCQNQFGQSWYIPPGMNCGSGPPPVGYTPIPSQPAPPYTPTTPPPPYTPTAPTQPPATPPPPPSCIKICPPDKPDCPDKKYCIWQDSDTKVCYVLPEGQSPRRSSDRKLTCSVPSDSWISTIVNNCGQPSQQQPSQPSSPGLPGFTQQVGCDSLFRWQNITTDLPSDFFRQLAGQAADQAILGLGLPDGIAADIAKDTVNSIATVAGAVIDAIARAIAMNPLLNCSGQLQESAVIATRLLTGLASRYLSGAAESADTSLSYAQNSLCPFRIPSNGEATASWLANNIDLDRLRCIVEANGNRWDSFYPVADASRTKLSIGEYAVLFRRQLVTQQQYEQKTREAGVTRDDDRSLAYQLTEYIPTPADIIPLMIRDTADTENIDWSESDRIFGQKYVSPLSDWGEKQGVSTEFMKMLWRGHWILPPPTQLAEMLHRNSRLPPNDPAYVDMARIRQTLLQQDIHPDWVDAYIAISYAPLTRIDSVRAYKVGALDVDGLTEAYLNLGYKQNDADTLVKFNVIAAQQVILRRPELRQYANGELTAQEMYDSLRTFGARDADLPVAYERATAMLSINRRKRCVAAIRKRFMLAEISLIDVQTELQGQGLDQNQVEEISAGMQCERNARGKVLTGQQILSLYRDGIITEADVFDRLMRIGYDEDEANLLVRQMAQRIQIKLQKDQLAQLKQQQADARRLKNAIDKQNRQAASAQAKAVASAERARATKERREKRLLEAAKLISEHTGLSFSDAVFYARNLHVANITTTAATPDESINAIGVAASDKYLTTTDQISAAVATAISALT